MLTVGLDVSPSSAAVLVQSPFLQTLTCVDRKMAIMSVWLDSAVRQLGMPCKPSPISINLTGIGIVAIRRHTARMDAKNPLVTAPRPVLEAVGMARAGLRLAMHSALPANAAPLPVIVVPRKLTVKTPAASTNSASVTQTRLLPAQVH